MQPGHLWPLRSTGSNRDAKSKRKEEEDIKGTEQGDGVCAGSSLLIHLSDIDGMPSIGNIRDVCLGPISHLTKHLTLFAYDSLCASRLFLPSSAWPSPPPGNLPCPGVGSAASLVT